MILYINIVNGVNNFAKNKMYKMNHRTFSQKKKEKKKKKRERQKERKKKKLEYSKKALHMFINSNNNCR